MELKRPCLINISSDDIGSGEDGGEVAANNGSLILFDGPTSSSYCSNLVTEDGGCGIGNDGDEDESLEDADKELLDQ
jgi:hypothetical protein